MTRIGIRNIQTGELSLKVNERGDGALRASAARQHGQHMVYPRARQCDQIGLSSGWIARDPRSQVTGGSARPGPWKRARPWVKKKLTHLWHGVAPGSDGQTHRIFDRAQDWHARGRYFWTSGVARERSPDAGVESGMVTASRVSGEEQQCSVCGWCLCSGSRLSLTDSLGLGTLCFFFLSRYYHQVMPWP